MFSDSRKWFLAFSFISICILTGCGGAPKEETNSPTSPQPSPRRDSSPSTNAQAEEMMGQGGLALGEENYENALNYYLQAAQLYDSTGEDSPERAEAHTQAASMAYRIGNPEQALEEYQKAADIFVKYTGNTKIKGAVALNNMGTIYKELERPDDARRIWERALKIYQTAPKEHQNQRHMATIEQNLSDLSEGF